ncbi:MAG TPA: hypothetical protein VIY48_07750 [Candidatus Paceibacterota bacterium]
MSTKNKIHLIAALASLFAIGVMFGTIWASPTTDEIPFSMILASLNGIMALINVSILQKGTK